MLSTLVVNNPLDSAVANELSLRQAVATADTDAAAGTSDTIVFDSSLGSATIKLTQGTLELSGAAGTTITIDGSAPSTPLTIDGSQNDNETIFQVDAGVQVVMQNLTIQNGTATSGADGGAILNAGTLTVSDITFSNNSATSSAGGAIENQGTLTIGNATFAGNSAGSGGAIDNTGQLTVSDSTFSNNHATNFSTGVGGAISNEGHATLSNTTFTGNSAEESGGAIDNAAGTLTVTAGYFTTNSAQSGAGGAIESTGGTVMVTDITVSGNSAEKAGGGIDNTAGMLTVTDSTLSGNTSFQNGGGLSNAGTLTVDTSTLSGNTADQDGGGIDTTAGTLTLQNSTLSGNTADSAGGGIDNNIAGTLALQNTIVSANTSFGTNPDIAGTITTDSGNNLLGKAVNNTTIDPVPGPNDFFSDTPLLAALGSYGGLTQTMALLAGSAALGAGVASAGISTDQRGLPLDSPKPDIGAFQTQPAALVFSSLGETADAGQPAPISVGLQDLDGNPVSAGLSYSGNATTADASGTTNLTLVGGAGFAPGQSGQAISLSGTKQYAITPNLVSLFPNNDANVTVSLWFNAAGPGVILDELGQTTLNTGWHDSQIEILANGTVEVRVWDLSAVILGTASFNAWHNVVLRYNAATQTEDGFLDGVPATSPVTGSRSTPYGSGYGLYYAFGATDTTNLGSGAYFNGLIQDINIFNRPLSNAEVQTLYAGGGTDIVKLSSSSTGGSFAYPNGVPISGGQIVIPPGASSVTVNYTDSQAGTPTLTASATDFPSVTQQETILPAQISDTSSPDIVVGRTLSAYFTADVQNSQETITFTVYNEQADPLTGVLLTDTLLPGVTYQSASQLPDQSGQNLAWSMGTIQGFDRASVTLTVTLPSTVPLQLDTGAQAFATLDGGPTSNSTPAATLRQGSVDPDLLASTPDANTTDPFIQEEAAELDYNPEQIFTFLESNVGYNSYTGSVRGARGTLWSDAGNALDVASLGIALMRASGIPAQYVSGTLSQSQAQQLILSMFPANDQTDGYIPAGTTTADPANDSQLLSETEAHYWIQFNAGGGMEDADPLMAAVTSGGQVGQAFTAGTGAFTEVLERR